jgi:microcystin-dependent protein
MSNPYVGEIRLFAGNFAPQGWNFCDGSLLAISQNTALFALLGTTYGGNGQTTFALPDLRGRVPVHQGTGGGLTGVMGQSGGTETVTLAATRLPGHTHALNAVDAAGDQTDPAGHVWAQSDALIYANSSDGTMNPGSLASTGAASPQAHDNMMPFLCVNFIISLFGVFPPRN